MRTSIRTARGAIHFNDLMRNQSRINGDWTTPKDGFTWEHAGIEVLMDIRGELQRLNALLHCHNFVRIPHVLDKIESNTKRRKPKAKAKNL